jgi:chaperone modulatory protein CbpM
MAQSDVLTAVLLDEAALTVEELALACSVEPDWVMRRVQTGILLREAPPQATLWRFTSSDLARARRLREIELEFDADENLAALVVDLSDEVRRLKTRLRAAGLG